MMTASPTRDCQYCRRLLLDDGADTKHTQSDGGGLAGLGEFVARQHVAVHARVANYFGMLPAIQLPVVETAIAIARKHHNDWKVTDSDIRAAVPVVLRHEFADTNRMKRNLAHRLFGAARLDDIVSEAEDREITSALNRAMLTLLPYVCKNDFSARR